MKELKLVAHFISGGNPLAAINTYVIVFGAPAAIIGAVQVYDNVGHQIGETVFNVAYPDPLGQMVYTAEDFK